MLVKDRRDAFPNERCPRFVFANCSRMRGKQEVDHSHGCVYSVSESPTTVKVPDKSITDLPFRRAANFRTSYAF